MERNNNINQAMKLPKDWQVVKLGGIAIEMYYGVTAKAVDYKTNLKMLRTTDIKNFNVNWDSLPYCEITEKRNEISKYLLEKGDIIIARAGTVGVSVLVDRKLQNVVFGSYLIKVKLKSNISPSFLHLVLQSKIFWEHLRKAQGSTLKNINLPFLKSLKIPLPPLPEQHRIAKVLATVDAAIEKTEREIKITERLKRGLMQWLLTRGIGHEKFKETELGRIPEEWEVVRLGEIIDIQSGAYFPYSEFRERGVKCFKIDNVSFGEIKWDTISYLPKEYLTKYPELILNAGDIVLALNRPIINGKLKIGILKDKDVPAILYQRVGKFIFKEHFVSRNYLFYLLNGEFFKRELLKLLVGTDQPYIRTPIFLKLKIPLPPLSEQRKIAEILSTVDKKLELLRERRERLKRVKRGLMNNLLTGRKRVLEEVV